MEIKARTTIDMDLTEEEIIILNNACTLFNEIENDLRHNGYTDNKKVEILFDNTSYSYSDFRKMSDLLCDMVEEFSRQY